MAKVQISIPDEDLAKIRNFCEIKDFKLSSIFRQGAKEILKRENANN